MLKIQNPYVRLVLGIIIGLLIIYAPERFGLSGNYWNFMSFAVVALYFHSVTPKKQFRGNKNKILATAITAFAVFSVLTIYYVLKKF